MRSPRNTTSERSVMALSKYESRPEGPMLPTEDGYLDYVAMENDMTGAYTGVTQQEIVSEVEAYGSIYNELYGLPLEAGEPEEPHH